MLKREWTVAGGFAVMLVIAAKLTVPASAAAASACKNGFAPTGDDYGNTCCIEQLVADGFGGSICSTTRARTLGKTIRRLEDFDNVPLPGPHSDPDFSIMSSRAKAEATSTSGTTTQSSYTTIDGEGAGLINAPDIVKLHSGGTALRIGGFVGVETIKQNLTDPTSGAGVEKDNTDTFKFGPMFWLSSGDAHIGGKLGFDIGSGKETAANGDSGNYRTNGLTIDLLAGRDLTLSDHRTGHSARSSDPALSATGGYRIALGLDGFLRYDHQQIGQFTDTAGTAFGGEHSRMLSGGGRLSLYEDIFRDGYILTPYAGISGGSVLSYDHQIDDPAGGAPVSLSLPGRGFASASAGLRVEDANGIIVGLEGYHGGGAGTVETGGRVYLQFDLDRPASH